MPRAVMHSMVKGSRNVDIEENEVNNDANVSASPVAFCLSTGLKSSKAVKYVSIVGTGFPGVSEHG